MTKLFSHVLSRLPNYLATSIGFSFYLFYRYVWVKYVKNIEYYGVGDIVERSNVLISNVNNIIKNHSIYICASKSLPKDMFSFCILTYLNSVALYFRLNILF